MSQTQVGIYNLALSAVGSRDTLASISENTPGARECNRWYEPVRRTAFRAAHWKSLREYSRLPLLTERNTAEDWVDTDPHPGWLYAYGAPNDMVAPRYLTTFQTFDSGIYASSSVQAIFTNVEDAVLCYTADRTDPSLWDNALYMAVVHALAGYIAIPVSGKRDRSRDLLDAANKAIAEARADTANAMERKYDTIPDWIASRGYSGGIASTRYIADYGPLFATVGGPLG